MKPGSFFGSLTTSLTHQARRCRPQSWHGPLWAVAAVVITLLAVAGIRSADLWPDIHNPFSKQKTDRSGPVLLRSIHDLSRYVAAEGHFEVIIDLQKNHRYVPDILVNDRTLFVAVGAVEAYVDFTTISEGAIVDSADHTTATITLPHPQLGAVHLNNDHSYVYTQERGLLNRVGDVFKNDPNKLQEVYQLAEDKIAKAARDSDLHKRAQDNTRKMLEGMLRSLGYRNVTITFAKP